MNEEILCSEEKEILQRFSLQAAALLLILYALCFWAGLHFLREDIFKHFFNPSRHLIIEQNPNTFEILAWKDTRGNVYTPDDFQVKVYPFAVFALGLVEAVALTGVYYFLKWHCSVMLLFKRSTSTSRFRGEPGT